MKKKQTIRRWTATELAQFRKLAKQGLSGTAIAKKLKRTKGATYQRAALEGIKLKSNRTRRAR